MSLTLRPVRIAQVTGLVTRFTPVRMFSPFVCRCEPGATGGARRVRSHGAHLTGMTDEPRTDARIPVILTPQEVSDLLHIPPSTLSDWRLHRAGPAYLRIGHHVRYELTAVLAWLEERRHA